MYCTMYLYGVRLMGVFFWFGSPFLHWLEYNISGDFVGSKYEFCKINIILCLRRWLGIRWQLDYQNAHNGWEEAWFIRKVHQAHYYLIQRRAPEERKTSRMWLLNKCEFSVPINFWFYMQNPRWKPYLREFIDFTKFGMEVMISFAYGVAPFCQESVI